MSMVILEKVMITPQQKVLYICLKADNFSNTEVGFELKSLWQIAVYVPHSAKGIRAICLEIHTGEGQMSTTEKGQIWLTAAYFLQTAGDDGKVGDFGTKILGLGTKISFPPKDLSCMRLRVMECLVRSNSSRWWSQRSLWTERVCLCVAGPSDLPIKREFRDRSSGGNYVRVGGF